MKSYLLLIILISSCIPNSQNDVSTETSKYRLKIQNTVEYNIENKSDINSIIDVLDGFFETKDSSYVNNPYWLENDNSFYKYPFYEFSTLENYGSSKLRPNLLSITEINNNHFICKLGWFYDYKNTQSLQFIYNVSVIKKNERFLLKNILSHNIKDWKKLKIGNITYWIPEHVKINRFKAEKYNNINEKISTFFGAKLISFSYIYCDSNEQLMRLIGYDFDQSMYLQDQNGSVTYTDDNLIFSGNNSEINTHELVHLYVAEKFTQANPFINEGIATFLGGSKGLSYEDHLFKLKIHLNNNDINIYDEYFFGNYVLDSDTSLRYTLSAFLCDLALREIGKKGLFELLNCGISNYDIIDYIDDFFKVNSSNFNEFIKNELQEYDFDSIKNI